MLGVDSLVVIGATVLNLGTIKESDGIVERSFWLRNDYKEPVTLIQGYTSCGCTTIDYTKDTPIASGDSTKVTLRFNPRGKGGEFYENGTVVFINPNGKPSSPQGNGVGTRIFTNMALEGTCITSEETLLKQFPFVINDNLRLSNNHFDVGYMSPGQSRSLNVSVLHRDENDRKEVIPVTFLVDDKMQKGLQHIKRTYTTLCKKKKVSFSVIYDVIIR